MLTEREIYALWVEYPNGDGKLVRLYTDRGVIIRKAEELNRGNRVGARYSYSEEQLLEGENEYG
jgi:hypothetical protein